MWCCVVSERRYGETQAYLDSEVMHWNCLMLLKCRTFHLLWGWCHILMKCFQKTFIKVSVFLWLPFFHSQTVTPFLITHCGNICRGCLSAGRLLQASWVSWVYWRLSAFRTNTRVVSLQDQCCFQRFEKEITYLTCKSSSNASHFY